jgi:iron complex outermembrane receptor protein
MSPKFLLVLILSFMISFGFSQLPKGLDTIIVQSSLIPVKISETGRNITIIDRKQIESLPATTIDEILQFSPGVEVQSRGGFGVQSDFLIRGSTFTQVLILIDGMKINDPLTGHFNGYIPVTPSEIERIEILRGAAAALYGADAVGGVINIITKTFYRGHEAKSEISGRLNYGQHDLVSGNQGFFHRRGKSAFSGGFLLNQSVGENIGERIIDSTTTLPEYNTHFDIKTLGFSFSHAFNDQISLNLRTAYNASSFNARYFYTNSPFDQSKEMVNQWFNQLQLVRISENGVTDLNFSFKRNRDEFIFSPDFPSTNEHTTDFANLLINHHLLLTSDLSIKIGAQFDQRKIESNDRGNHEDLHAGLYAMAAFHSMNWHFTGSIRGDYDENYGFELTPQLNTSYTWSSLVLRGAFGRSIRAADYTERFVSNNLKDLSPLRNLGNPSLNAENSWSGEMGLDLNLSDAWQFKTSFFIRTSDNLIDYVLTNQKEIGSVSAIGSLQDGADYLFAKNISSVNTSGWELDVLWRKKMTSNLFGQIGLSYTFLDTENPEESVYLSNHANHLVNAQALFRYNWLDISMGCIFKERNTRISTSIGEELDDSYFVSHLRLGFRPTETIGIHIQIQNLGDTKYQNFLGAPMPSRWFMAGINWNLDIE